MSCEVTQTHEIEIDTEDGSIFMLIEIIAKFNLERDRFYGADADGNRFESRTFISLDHFIVYSAATGLNITNWLRAKHPKEFEEIRAHIDLYMADKAVEAA